MGARRARPFVVGFRRGVACAVGVVVEGGCSWRVTELTMTFTV